MSLFNSVLLGIVQGLGEFLPISSSAHLLILPWLMNFKTPGLTFDIALHFGTLISLLVFFYKDWIQLIKAWFTSLKKKPKQYNFEEKLIWYLIFATIPAGIVGLIFQDYIELLLRKPIIVATMMAVFGILLYLVDQSSKKNQDMKQISFKQAMMIGFAQCFALIPGSSRSGVTITAGLLCKLDRESAARFSFLLSTPIVAGAAMLKLPEFIKMNLDFASVIGIIVSAVIGYLAIKYMLRLLKNYSFLGYVIYRLIFAVTVFAALAMK